MKTIFIALLIALCTTLIAQGATQDARSPFNTGYQPIPRVLNLDSATINVLTVQGKAAFGDTLDATAERSKIIIPQVEEALKGQITFTFDDAYKTQYDSAFAMFQAAGKKASFLIPTDVVGYSGLYMTWDEVISIYTAGFEIVNHSKTHPMPFYGLSDSELEIEVLGAKNILKAHGIETPSFAYPGCSSDKKARKWVSRYHDCARSCVGTSPVFESPPINTYTLNAKNFEMNIPIDTTKVKAWIDTAYTEKKWLILVTHGINPSKTPLQIVLNYAIAKGINIVTLHEGFENYRNPIEIGDNYIGGDYGEKYWNFAVGKDGLLGDLRLRNKDKKKVYGSGLFFQDLAGNFPTYIVPDTGDNLIFSVKNNKWWKFQDEYGIFAFGIRDGLMAVCSLPLFATNKTNLGDAVTDTVTITGLVNLVNDTIIGDVVVKGAVKPQIVYWDLYQDFLSEYTIAASGGSTTQYNSLNGATADSVVIDSIGIVHYTDQNDVYIDSVVLFRGMTRLPDERTTVLWGDGTNLGAGTVAVAYYTYTVNVTVSSTWRLYWRSLAATSGTAGNARIYSVKVYGHYK